MNELSSIQFLNHSGIHRLKATQELPITIEEAWEFFAAPANLSKITPPHMEFKITSGTPVTMYPGQIITYKVAPFPGIRTNWVTEITGVLFQKYFIDEQRYGPYSMWHHEHYFTRTGRGVLMTDMVSYKIPGGLAGRLMMNRLIRNQLKKIFSYRRNILEDMFGSIER